MLLFLIKHLVQVKMFYSQNMCSSNLLKNPEAKSAIGDCAGKFVVAGATGGVKIAVVVQP